MPRSKNFTSGSAQGGVNQGDGVQLIPCSDFDLGDYVEDPASSRQLVNPDLAGYFKRFCSDSLCPPSRSLPHRIMSYIPSTIGMVLGLSLFFSYAPNGPAVVKRLWGYDDDCDLSGRLLSLGHFWGYTTGAANFFVAYLFTEDELNDLFVSLYQLRLPQSATNIYNLKQRHWLDITVTILMSFELILPVVMTTYNILGRREAALGLPEAILMMSGVKFMRQRLSNIACGTNNIDIEVGDVVKHMRSFFWERITERMLLAVQRSKRNDSQEEDPFADLLSSLESDVDLAAVFDRLSKCIPDTEKIYAQQEIVNEICNFITAKNPGLTTREVAGTVGRLLSGFTLTPFFYGAMDSGSINNAIMRWIAKVSAPASVFALGNVLDYYGQQRAYAIYEEWQTIQNRGFRYWITEKLNPVFVTGSYSRIGYGLVMSHTTAVVLNGFAANLLGFLRYTSNEEEPEGEFDTVFGKLTFNQYWFRNKIVLSIVVIGGMALFNSLAIKKVTDKMYLLFAKLLAKLGLVNEAYQTYLHKIKALFDLIANLKASLEVKYGISTQENLQTLLLLCFINLVKDNNVLAKFLGVEPAAVPFVLGLLTHNLPEEVQNVCVDEVLDDIRNACEQDIGELVQEKVDAHNSTPRQGWCAWAGGFFSSRQERQGSQQQQGPHEEQPFATEQPLYGSMGSGRAM